MQQDLLALVASRRGHFRMESGYHSDQWFELDRLFADRARLQPFITELAQRLARHRVDIVCGPMSGGAKLAELIARELGAFYAFSERFESPDASGLFPVKYRLPPELREFVRGKSVALVDDAISAGSAIRGTYADLTTCGARTVALGALFVFGDAAATFAAQHHLALESLAPMTFGMWKPNECPLCRAGTPVERVSDTP